MGCSFLGNDIDGLKCGKEMKEAVLPRHEGNVGIDFIIWNYGTCETLAPVRGRNLIDLN